MKARPDLRPTWSSSNTGTGLRNPPPILHIPPIRPPVARNRATWVFDITYVGGPYGDEETIQGLFAILEKPTVTPAIRAAVFNALAEIPGTTLDPDARDVTGENGPLGLQPIGIVMLCVTWSVKDAKVTGTESQLRAVLHRNYLIVPDCPGRAP